MNKIAMTQSASRQALLFLAVGASAAGVHFLVLVAVVSVTTISPAWANVVAFLIAFVVSFLGHFYLTFNTNKPTSTTLKKTTTLQTLAKWFTSSVLGFIVNQGLFVLGLNWFGERYYILIWLIVTGIITIMTFALGKLWAFKP